MRGVETLCRRAARATLVAALPRGESGEVSIVLGDDRRMRDLNRRWRGKDRPTNVLSFPNQAPVSTGARRGLPLLGDVFLGLETVRAQAAAWRRPLPHHLAHLVTHGVLHLLGHDHEREAETRRMEAIEIRVLDGLGVPDPYAPTATAAPARRRGARRRAA